MTGAIFEVDRFGELPLWAQALMASRAARRAALYLPAETPEDFRAALIAGCDALDRCAERGERMKAELPAIEKAKGLEHARHTAAAVMSFYYAADACHAANDSMDFSAAESACTSSTAKALALCAEMPGLSPLRVRIFAAADFDLLRFACGEFRIGRYDGLTTNVFGRLAPVNPPDPREAAPRGAQAEHPYR